MNVKLICSFLGSVAFSLGLAMLACTLWGLPVFGGTAYDVNGVAGLVKGAATCFAAALIFTFFGRNASANRAHLRDALAGVAFCWIVATLLAATPYLFSEVERGGGCRVGVCDAIFESASGLTTTGGTIFSELEDPSTLPRTISFWRSMTHFLGGIGVMCCFVAVLGKGAEGKAVLKAERLFSGNLPFAKMKELAFSLFKIYLTICVGCFIWLFLCGASVYDSAYHAFSTAALGGFSSYNDSLGHFAHDPNVNAPFAEVGVIIFMIISGTNYWLLYWALRGNPDKIVKDFEWRAFVGSLLLAALFTTFVGAAKGDFVTAGSSYEPFEARAESASREHLDSEISARDETNESNAEDGRRGRRRGEICSSYLSAFRKSMFHVTSLATGAGFVTDRYESWNATTSAMLLVLMFVGGCSASTAGGIKVFRAVLTLKVLARETERRYRPSVVRSTRIAGENVSRETASVAVRYVVIFACLIVATTLVVTAIEPDATWASYERPQMEKLIDLGTGALSMFANVGPRFGEYGSFNDYGSLTDLTKLIFSWAMIVGRLEIWPMLAILSARFWRNR